MNVKQLVELLQKCPASAEVFVPGPNGFERTPEGRFEMHQVRWVCSTGWTPGAAEEPAKPCVVLSRDELPLPGDVADEPTGMPN